MKILLKKLKYKTLCDGLRLLEQEQQEPAWTRKILNSNDQYVWFGCLKCWMGEKFSKIAEDILYKRLSNFV